MDTLLKGAEIEENEQKKGVLSSVIFLKNDNLRETKDFKCKVKALPDVHAILKIGLKLC